MFTPSAGAFLTAWDTFLFEESTIFAFNPIDLTVLMCTEVHADKIVLNPGAVTCSKGRDELPALIINSTSKFEEIQKKTVVDLIRNLNDGKIQYLTFLHNY